MGEESSVGGGTSTLETYKEMCIRLERTNRARAVEEEALRGKLLAEYPPSMWRDNHVRLLDERIAGWYEWAGKWARWYQEADKDWTS